MKVDLRRPWPFALFVLVAHVTSRFIGVAVHEFLGHAAFAFLLGGSAYGVYASPGSGVTFVYLPQDTPAAAVVAMLGAGIGVEASRGCSCGGGPAALRPSDGARSASSPGPS